MIHVVITTICVSQTRNYWEGCILISTLHVYNTKGTLDEGYKYLWHNTKVMKTNSSFNCGRNIIYVVIITIFVSQTHVRENGYSL
jgi:hypothetical protein